MKARPVSLVIRHLFACLVALALTASPIASHAAPATRSFAPPAATGAPAPQKLGLLLHHCRPATDRQRTVCAAHCLGWNVSEPQARLEDPRTAKKVLLAPPQSLIVGLAAAVAPQRVAERWRPGEHAPPTRERVFALTLRYRI